MLAGSSFPLCDCTILTCSRRWSWNSDTFYSHSHSSQLGAVCCMARTYCTQLLIEGWLIVCVFGSDSTLCSLWMLSKPRPSGSGCSVNQELFESAFSATAESFWPRSSFPLCFPGDWGFNVELSPAQSCQGPEGLLCLFLFSLIPTALIHVMHWKHFLKNGIPSVHCGNMVLVFLKKVSSLRRLQQISGCRLQNL